MLKILVQTGTEIAESQLEATDPLRLGLALNYAVFYYEIQQEADLAFRHAQKAIDDGIAELNSLSEEEFCDAVFVIRLLTDNLALWKHSDTDEREPQPSART
ncbi:14-3-3 domain protein [Metarhizium guizhouense ARSEF 977]|uniref:14-3-3 domain protein n=1 Tax=Metarhizium guizhouense (strain ARSEF 977) TaxID=1276136 RepID=A0A0B4GP27_METGA|nr:14-3-3 domain protein [Metarhizium guizhouense ARSEF 977]